MNHDSTEIVEVGLRRVHGFSCALNRPFVARVRNCSPEILALRICFPLSRPSTDPPLEYSTTLGQRPLQRSAERRKRVPQQTEEIIAALVAIAPEGRTFCRMFEEVTGEG